MKKMTGGNVSAIKDENLNADREFAVTASPYVWKASLLCCGQKIPSQSVGGFLSGSFWSFPYSWVSPIVKENNTSRKRPRNFPNSCSI